jgi:hypothetical protein
MLGSPPPVVPEVEPARLLQPLNRLNLRRPQSRARCSSSTAARTATAPPVAEHAPRALSSAPSFWWGTGIAAPMRWPLFEPGRMGIDPKISFEPFRARRDVRSRSCLPHTLGEAMMPTFKSWRAKLS